MMVALSSDHAGIAAELKRLEREMYRVVARIEDPRYVRDYLLRLQTTSKLWLEAHPYVASWDRKK